MNTFAKTLLISAVAAIVSTSSFGAILPKYTWRYYRPGNTGIQGDFNESIWIGPDGDPWIGGYDPQAQEGGIAKFIQSQNRWLNVSNIDYPVIGSANDVGYIYVSDMVADGRGNLWIGTMRGALRMNLALGPASLVRFDSSNSGLPGGATADISLAPDGTLWFSSYSTMWGGGGLTRYDPTTNRWTHMSNHGGDKIAAQPKQGGGYFIWAAPPGYIMDNVERWDSNTNSWTSFPPVAGNPSHLVSKNSVDDSGNVWIRRWYGNQGEEKLDCARPDGSWVSPPLPPPNGNVSVSALLAFGNLQALMVDGFMHLQEFNGVAWTDRGAVPHNSWIDDLRRDSVGNVWLCGTGMGGALKRTAATGAWQRYRITNTSQFDLFNKDLALDPLTGNVYACANAGPGVGGFVKFDGARWKGFVNDLDYGLGGPWPFPNSPQSEAIYVRRSNGHVVANPINDYTHEFDGVNWISLNGGPDQVQNYVEDSSGRLWCAGHYGGIGVFETGNYRGVEGGGMFNKVYADTQRAGTVWGCLDYHVVRTDGNGYRFEATMSDFPLLNGSSFSGLAVQPDGVAWAGTYSPGSQFANGLVKINPNTGSKQVMFRYGGNWPFPGEYVQPVAYTPDGRLWLAYGKEYPFDDMGLCWWDGVNVGKFPAPPNGEWRWGGLPHYILTDVEWRTVPGGYELWMACFSRGIAVLKVQYPTLASQHR
ncbi:MAG: hypothetical protein U0R49_03980 [Fimbriimonadales bacterium]